MTQALLAQDLLKGVPDGLRSELLLEFGKIQTHFRHGRWEPTALNGGKFCEVAHSIVHGHLIGTFPKKATKPKNFVQACIDLEKLSATSNSRSLRIQIPRLLIALYEVRNNRGVGHVGGDVAPNHMDAQLVIAIARWVVAELIRIFHDVTISEATGAVEALTTRIVPSVWEVAGKKRVLDTRLGMKDRSLLLLYREAIAVSEQDLCSWTEHSNPAVYRRDILTKAHKAKLVEYDRDTHLVHLSPLGVRYVEEQINPHVAA